MKFYVPDMKFLMMLGVSLGGLVLLANATGYSAKVKQYLGVG